MADVRSMLKTQRSSRQVKHPHAAYTAKGQLSCTICRVQLKSEGQWEQHVRSQQHDRSIKQIAAEHGSTTSKKRKAAEDEEASSKRVRSDSVPSRPRVGVDESESRVAQTSQPEVEKDQTTQGEHAHIPGTSIEADDGLNDELAAFEREMAELDQQEEEKQERSKNARRAYEATPAVSAQPMTAAELAARDREERSAQRSARDVELEDEREEAVGQLQDEFERMNRLDEKVKELRARKAALAEARSTDRDTSAPDVIALGHAQPGSDEDSGSEEELDEWAFGKAGG